MEKQTNNEKEQVLSTHTKKVISFSGKDLAKIEQLIENGYATDLQTVISKIIEDHKGN